MSESRFEKASRCFGWQVAAGARSCSGCVPITVAPIGPLTCEELHDWNEHKLPAGPVGGALSSGIPKRLTRSLSKVTSEPRPRTMSEEIVEPIPNLSLASKSWTLQQPKLQRLHAQAKQDLLQGIEADGPFQIS